MKRYYLATWNNYLGEVYVTLSQSVLSGFTYNSYVLKPEDSNLSFESLQAANSKLRELEKLGIKGLTIKEVTL